MLTCSGRRQSFLYPESTWPTISPSSSSSSSSSSPTSSRSFVNASISNHMAGYTAVALVDSTPSSSGLVSSCRKRKLSEREKARKVEIKKKHMMEIEAPVINVAISGFQTTKPVAIDNALAARAFGERNCEFEKKVTCLSLPSNEPTSLPVSSRTGELKRKMFEMERADEQFWKNDKKRARLNGPVCFQAMIMFLNINTAIQVCRRQTVQSAHRYSRICQSGCLKRGGGFMENVYGCPPIMRRLVL